MVALISWIPLPEGETRVGRDGAGGGSSWLRIFMRMSPKRLSPRHRLRSEGLPVGRPEADTPDEVVRAASARNSSPVSGSCWRKGRVENWARLPL